MKQWATTAWRRQRLYGRRGASDNKGSRARTSRNNSPAEPSFVSARPQLQSHSIVPPLLPFNHISAQCGETLMNGNAGLSPDASNNGMSVSEDPEGAALGITGRSVPANQFSGSYRSVSFVFRLSRRCSCIRGWKVARQQ